MVCLINSRLRVNHRQTGSSLQLLTSGQCTHRAGMRHPSEFRSDRRLSGQNRIFWGFQIAGDSPGTRKPKRLQRSMSASAIMRQVKLVAARSVERLLIPFAGPASAPLLRRGGLVAGMQLCLPQAAGQPRRHSAPDHTKSRPIVLAASSLDPSAPRGRRAYCWPQC